MAVGLAVGPSRLCASSQILAVRGFCDPVQVERAVRTSDQKTGPRSHYLDIPSSCVHAHVVARLGETDAVRDVSRPNGSRGGGDAADGALDGVAHPREPGSGPALDSANGPRMRQRLSHLASISPWALAVGTISLAITDLWLEGLNGTRGPADVAELTFVASAVIGAVLAVRRPRNPVGWLLCALPFVSSLTFAVGAYGDFTFLRAAGSLPLGAQAIWLSFLLWVPVVGLGLPMLIVRLPDGHMDRAWRAVDWLAAGGTLALLASNALMPGRMTALTNTPNPFGLDGAVGLLIAVRVVGYVLVLTALAGSVARLFSRLRTALGDEREQIKWIASSGAVMTAALLVGFISQASLHESLANALTPFFFASLTLPVAIGVAVLKYRLYEINLIINRTLVYGTMTAGLAGLYAASTALAQALIAFTGQRSNVAVLLTAFVGAMTFTPVKGWLQKSVDRRFAVNDPAAEVDGLRRQIELVVNVLDPHLIARRLVDHIAVSFQPTSVSLTLLANGELVPLHSRGEPSGEAALSIPLQSHDADLGVLKLGERRGGLIYTERDRLALRQCADAVADALVVTRQGGPASDKLPKGAPTHFGL